MRSLKKFLASPVLVAAEVSKVQDDSQSDDRNLLSIRHVAAHDQRDLLLAQLFDSDLQRIGLSLQVDEDRSVHAIRVLAILSGSSFFRRLAAQRLSQQAVPDLQSSRAQDSCLLVLGHVGCGNALVVGNLLVLV